MELLRSWRYKLSVSTFTLSFIVICLLFLSQVSDRAILEGPKKFTFTLESDQNFGRAGSSSSSGRPGLQKHPARELIESIKEARRLASGTSNHQSSDDSRGIREARLLVSGPSDDLDSGGDGDEADEHDLEEWKHQNPCVSRLELMPVYEQRKHAKKLDPNPLWEELIVEYSKLHRVCMKNVGNITDYFVTGNMSVPGCQFAVADIAGSTGLGNKFYVTVSSLLYAILTKRVVLIPSATLLPDYICEPFLGSSWRLDSETFPVPRYFNDEAFENSLWTRNLDFFREIDEAIGKMDNKVRKNFDEGLIVPAARLRNAVGVFSHEWQPDNRFYCSAEQTFYSQSTWVYLSGCIYTIPKIFASPFFRPILEELFPDKMVMTRLLRSLLLPADVVWGRVRRINQAYLASADRRVGIQVRYKNGMEHYNNMNDLVNERVMKCAQNFAILPDVNSSRIADSNLRHESASSPTPMVKVFVASLFSGLFDHLSRIFVRFPSLTGEEVSLVQVSQDLTQKLDDVEEDQQAMAEVLLLSFSDQLLVTPVSTFGGLAQGYGALTPWFIEMREDVNLPPCERGQTVDACDQFAEKVYKCPHDDAVNKRRFSDVLPYIKDCLAIDHPKGIQLVTDFRS